MKTLLTLLLATLCAATGYGQTIKALAYNTTNGVVVYSGTNDLRLPSSVRFGGDTRIISSILQFDDQDRISLEETRFVGDWTFAGSITFEAAASVRTNLGLGATWLTNTDVTNFRTAIGLGETNRVQFGDVLAQSLREESDQSYITFDDGLLRLYGDSSVFFDAPIQFPSGSIRDQSRTNLALGATNNVAFRNITSDGNIVISNQTATNNGLLFIYRTNNEPFLSLANLIASNNTTISNETLFRVGVAEATNRSAQFGFRSTNTNGNGVAVFSVFGYNALMQIGADASTNAVIYSGGGTNNEVMTLIRDGATEFARPIRFSTNASTRPSTNAPANTTNAAAWVEMRIGTNSYRVPLYQ